MYYIGIDIAKNSHEVCFLDTEGNILDGNSFNIRNNGSGFARLEQMLSRYHLSGDNTLVGMEATGHYWLVLYSWFLEKGFKVKVINPLVTDGYRHMQVRKAKTDRIDAEIVAKVLRLGEYQETSVLDEDILGIRQLCRYRLWLVSSCSDLKRKIIALLDQVFPEYSHLFSNVFGMASKELLKVYATPEEMLSVSTRKLSKLLEKTSRGHFGKPKAMEIKTLASQSVGIHLAQDAFAFQIRQMLEQLDFVETQIQDLEQEIQVYMDKLDSPVTSVPGVGPVYGAVILSEIGDIHRFPSGKQLVSYSGIDASVHESGDIYLSVVHLISGAPSGELLLSLPILIRNSQLTTSAYAPGESTTALPLALLQGSSATFFTPFCQKTDRLKSEPESSCPISPQSLFSQGSASGCIFLFHFQVSSVFQPFAAFFVLSIFQPAQRLDFL